MWQNTVRLTTLSSCMKNILRGMISQVVLWSNVRLSCGKHVVSSGPVGNVSWVSSIKAQYNSTKERFLIIVFLELR